MVAFKAPPPRLLGVGLTKDCHMIARWIARPICPPGSNQFLGQPLLLAFHLGHGQAISITGCIEPPRASILFIEIYNSFLALGLGQ